MKDSAITLLILANILIAIIGYSVSEKRHLSGVNQGLELSSMCFSWDYEEDSVLGRECKSAVDAAEKKYFLGNEEESRKVWEKCKVLLNEIENNHSLDVKRKD